MWIQVRTMDGKETHRVDSLSKLTKVDELRLRIMELFNVEPERQRLFYRGKQVGSKYCTYRFFWLETCEMYLCSQLNVMGIKAYLDGALYLDLSLLRNMCCCNESIIVFIAEHYLTPRIIRRLKIMWIMLRF